MQLFLNLKMKTLYLLKMDQKLFHNNGYEQRNENPRFSLGPRYDMQLHLI